MRLSMFVLWLAALLPAIHCFSLTDSSQDGDVSQSGYSSTHNLDPTKLSSYKLRWRFNTGTASEFFYAKPLVYTPIGASYERIYIVSDMNIVRVLDGLTGNVLLSRTLRPPFKSVDTQCGDIPNQVGIIGTPIIDSGTEIMYFWSKSYRNGQVGPLGQPTTGADNSMTGVANGNWQLYAVHLSDLSDAPGFPISIEGMTAFNDRTRYIFSGTLNQRPGLAMIGNTIVTGFGSHCDNFNFTGYLITASKTAGVGITDIQAMVAAPGAPTPQALDLTRQNNGKSGIWQAGVGLAVDASRNQVFFAVGNGQSPGQLKGDNGVPTPGLGNYLSTLENAVVNYNVDPNTGKLSQADWFVTTDYDHLNGEDKDVGSSGLALLDPTVFSGGGVKRIAVAAGKIARIIIMNADNLGGFKMGPGQTDGVLQEISFNPDNYAFFSGVASYPLEGGYIYFAPTSGSIMAYKFGLVNGIPQFTYAGQTNMIFAGKGAPRVTSLNGQPGTGIVWIADVNQGIQAFNAIPDANGILQPYNLVQVGRLNKFHRPQFGDGTIYTAELNQILAVGPPVPSSSPSSSTTFKTSTTSSTSTSSSSSGSKSSSTSSSSSSTSSTLSTSTSSSYPSSASASSTSSTSSSSSYPSSASASSTSSTSSTSSSSSYPSSASASSTSSTSSTSSSSSSSSYPSSASASSTSSSSSYPSSASASSTSSTLTTSSASSSSSYSSSASASSTSSTLTTSSTSSSSSSSSYPSSASASSTSSSSSYPSSASASSTSSTSSSSSYPSSASASSTSSSSSSSSLTSTSNTSSSPTSISSPASVSATSTSGTTSVTPSTVPAAPTDPFTYVGCYQDTSAGHALPLLFANKSVTPELCGAYVRSLANQPTPTIFNYFYVEYHQECYGGNTFNFQGSATSSLTGSNACTDVCSGSIGATSTGTAKCGGPNQFNLYVKGGTSNLPFGWPSVTATSTSTVQSSIATSSSTTSSIASSSTASSSTSKTLSSTTLSSTTLSSTTLSSTTSSSTTLSSTILSSTTSLSTTSLSTTSSSTTLSSTTLSSTTLSSTILSSTSLSSSASSSTTLSSSSTSKVITSSLTSSTPPAYVTPSPPAGKRTSINWNLTWVNAAPDGTLRPVIGINGQWPCPPIVLNYGDTLVLNVYNGLGNESTAIHFHGLQQRNTSYADGPSWVTQCPVPPGETVVYQFQALQIGTYWYHAHHAGQYIDGLRGPFIIKDPSPPYGKVDQDITLTLTDFYHEEAPYLINYYQSANNYYNTGGNEPLPDAALINEAQNVKFTMKPLQKNLFRVINMGAMAGQYLQFDGHNMTIIEVDGQYVQPYTVQQLFVAVAQRYTIIVMSTADASANYAIVATMDTSMFGDSGTPANPTVSGWLVYDATKPLPAPFTLTPKPWNELDMVPLDQMALFDPPSLTMYFSADFSADSNGIPRAMLNGVAYVNPKVPTLYTALTAPAQYLNNPSIYGTGVNPYIIPYGAIVEIQVDNHDDRAHPFHLHGHHFQVIYRGSGGSLFPGLESDTPPALPMRRDTIVVYPDNTATIRFVANNPGIQLFHCHTEWHVIGGMTATFIEAPTELVAQKLYIPASHRSICDNHGIPRAGNAAGNNVNWLNLTGAPTNAPTSNWGALYNPPS